MKAIRFVVFGYEVWSLEFGSVDDELDVSREDVEKMVDQIKGKKEVGGGQSLETERDHNAPPYPGSPMKEEYWRDDPFGFSKGL